jgi:hypothetical protein
MLAIGIRATYVTLPALRSQYVSARRRSTGYLLPKPYGDGREMVLLRGARRERATH